MLTDLMARLGLTPSRMPLADLRVAHRRAIELRVAATNMGAPEDVVLSRSVECFELARLIDAVSTTPAREPSDAPH